MSNQSLGNRVQTELKQAVLSGLLPDSDHEKAELLLERLQKPVRLAILGMPESGKSRLLNLLVGADVIPQGVHLPTMQLVYGENEKSVCTLADGSKEEFNAVDADMIAGLSPVFVEMQMPLPALNKISVLEVVAPNDTNAVHRASQWASKRTDVALWCTRGFTEPEQRIWATMPDLIKDHAFCMVTHADFLKAQGLYEAAVGAISAAAGDEFNAVLAIATNQALSARRADGSVDKDVMRESGGSALISAVLKQVEHGRQSAVDQADILLHQYADLLAPLKDAPVSPDVSTPPEPTPTPETVAAKEPAAPVAVPETAQAEAPKPAAGLSETKPATRDAISRLREIAARKNVSRDLAFEEAAKPSETPATEPEPEPEAQPSVDAAAEPLHPATRDAYEHVISYLEARGAELASVLEEQGQDGPVKVMTMAVDQIQWLCDYLNENGDASDVSLQRTRDTAFDAADMVQLMQMEKQGTAALEAISLMLQIKRELQADLAA
ncbi:hypothetical protein AN191_12115 [Loktanella sp. 5RATIMAR09]|uniref:hypothetical protein n=1 Tax=Loktanella sp. 5RATIMAR09 TaxID=1225655 RepID=UPI0006EBDCAF|nr:hypothetical protein [Loktanella sp. 5RATIMAR09]KQI71719.1 hypothetical protein AN191_12115 [Loktanella sp. 5RATIMAR09]